MKDKIIARAIDNVRVSINRVYFRFTDNMKIFRPDGHYDLKRYSLGIKLRSFQVFTTKSDYRTVHVRDDTGVYTNEEDKLTFKVALLKGFSLFCNFEHVDDVEFGAIDERKLGHDKNYLKYVLDQ